MSWLRKKHQCERHSRHDSVLEAENSILERIMFYLNSVSTDSGWITSKKNTVLGPKFAVKEITGRDKIQAQEILMKMGRDVDVNAKLIA